MPIVSHSEFPDPFRPGLLKEAHMIVLEQLPDREKYTYRGSRWRYRAECCRCGRIHTITHYSLIERIRRDSRSCVSCQLVDNSIEDNKKRVAAKARGEKLDDGKPLSFDYDRWVTPAWPVPSRTETSDDR